MTDDDDWEPSKLVAKADDAGTDRMSTDALLLALHPIFFHVTQLQFRLQCPRQSLSFVLQTQPGLLRRN